MNFSWCQWEQGLKSMEIMGALIIGLLAHTLRSDQYYEKVAVGTVEKTKFGSYEMTAECGGKS